MSRGRGLLALLVGGALLAFDASCSFVVDTSADQCQTDGDCASRGFDGWFCAADKICRCKTNKACKVRLGTDAVCYAGSCAALKSEDCQTVYMRPNDLDRDDAVVIGWMAPIVGENKSLVEPQLNAVDLARRDFADGLPPVKDGSPNRPLVVLACNDGANALRAAKHLVEDVHVPAIIGPAFSGVLKTIATEETIPKKTLLLSASATSPLITGLVDDGLVWRTCPSDAAQAIAMAQLVSTKVEADARKAFGLAVDDPSLRVMVVAKGDAYGLGLANALFDRLVFNKKSAADNGPALYKRVNYGDPTKDDAATLTASYANAVKAALDFKPHILLTVGTSEAVTSILTEVEKSWPAGARPRHLVSDGLQLPELAALARGNDMRTRLFGSIAGTDSPLGKKFRDAYNGAGFTAKPDAYAASAYDALYLLAYAVVGAGAKPITGPQLATALALTIPGTGAVPIKAGPEAIGTAMTALRTGGRIDYDGASGPLDFDLATGEAVADIQIWCVTPSAAAEPFANVGIFRAAGGVIDGTLVCPP
ncbi:MAG: ABC transporter substrate-binding protein [Myxococcales bacterium]|nr:ABC transporter substrate-binding protein [Myxococcales bacterium]